MTRSLPLALCLATLPVAAAMANAQAYVYVSTNKGINLYDAASNGSLSLVAGSPFQTTLPMIGSNGSHFLTLDNSDYATIHSYAVESNGAIGGQVSSINTQDYTGVNCGSPTSAILDHSGANIYVLLDTSGNCGAYQTYGVAKGSGDLSFKGAAVNNNIALSYCCSVPAITPKDLFAYTSEETFECDGCFNTWGAFKIESNGLMKNLSAPITGPTPKSSNLMFIPGFLATDPDNHLAVLGAWYDNNASQYTGGGGLASYTVNTKTGALSSSNSWKELPLPKNIGVDAMVASPSGKILALAGQYGLQFFHFNGASPLTTFGGLKTSVEIDQIAWDGNNHLYALSDAYNQYSSPNGRAELFVFTVTPSSIEEVPGSPFSMPGANGLVVVIK